MNLYTAAFTYQIKRQICVPTNALLLGIILIFVCPSIAQTYEVWITDQSDSVTDSGGFLYIYDAETLVGNPSDAKPSAILDLSTDVNALCQETTQKTVRRPHMVFFTKDQTHAVISFLTGHVLIMDSNSKKAVACLSVGKNVHAAWPTPDQKMILAANMAEKTLVRIWTDYSAQTFAYDPVKDVMNLARLENGELPDNAPICPVTDHSSNYGFVTLRGGGLLMVDVTAAPMKVVETFSDVVIHPAGCGGKQVGNTMYLNSGGGWPVSPLAYDVYAMNLSTLPSRPTVQMISSRDTMFADSHGMVVVGRYLWSADRAGNNVEIIDTLSDLSVNTINLSGSISEDPAPDLIDAAPDGTYVFVGLRGPHPLTGNHQDVNNAVGSTPGIGVIKVRDDGKGGEFMGVSRITNMKDGRETADPHGLAVRSP